MNLGMCVVMSFLTGFFLEGQLTILRDSLQGRFLGFANNYLQIIQYNKVIFWLQSYFLAFYWFFCDQSRNR